MAMPAQWARANVIYQAPGSKPMINVLFYVPGSTATVSQDTANLLAADVELAVHGNLKGVLTTATYFLGVTLSMHDGNLVFDAASGLHEDHGTVSGDETPDYVAAVVQKRSGNGGRSGRGRWFMGAVPEGLTDENRLTNAGIADYDALAAAYIAMVTSAGIDWNANLHTTHFNTLYPIISTRTDKYLGRQSRRRVRPPI